MRTNDNGVDREMTKEEIAAHNDLRAVAKREADALAAQEAARETARASARAKLAALGLTDAEITALLGA